MVIVVDLDEDALDPAIEQHNVHDFNDHRRVLQAYAEPGSSNGSAFAAILDCYPVVSFIARQLDLNSLHDLAASSRLIRAALLPNRYQLVRQTLRCVNDEARARVRDAEKAWSVGHGPGTAGKLTSGKVGICARDLVGECRRCGTTVCRNCTIKSPAITALKGRHRRLCRTCIKAPLQLHTHDPDVLDGPDGLSFTSEAFCKGACCCEDMVYLCLPCGSALRSSDITYMRGWTWRTRYSTYLGGLGTGIGEGNEGVECGKGDQCLAAKEIEKEIDCDAEELADLKHQIEDASRQGRNWGGTSYLTQEIEGIGGVVKKKVKKRIKVGAVVKEYEDEREFGHYLRREQTGLNRSHCYWCLRIVPGQKDKRPISRLVRSPTDASSSSVTSHSD